MDHKLRDNSDNQIQLDEGDEQKLSGDENVCLWVLVGCDHRTR